MKGHPAFAADVCVENLMTGCGCPHRVLAPQLYKSRTMHVFAWLEGPLFVMAIVRQLFLYLGELYAERYGN